MSNYPPAHLFHARRKRAEPRVHGLLESALGVRDSVPRMGEVEEHRVRLVLETEPVGADVPARGCHAVPKTVRLELLPKRKLISCHPRKIDIEMSHKCNALYDNSFCISWT